MIVIHFNSTNINCKIHNLIKLIVLTMFSNVQRDTNIVRQSNIVGTLHGMYHVQTAQNAKIFKLKDINQKQTPKSDTEFNAQIQVSSLFAWGILFLNCIFSAFVPCWLLADVKSQSFTRNSWRYLTLSCLLIPFVMYEQRNLKDDTKKLWNVATKYNLKVIFISTINFCIWLLLLINACRWTSMNHAVCLSGLRIVIISLMKFKNNQKFHEFQVGGTMLSMIGIFLVLTDSITLPQVFDHQSEAYLKVEPWKRLIFGDGLALLGGFASYYLDQNHKVPQMPRFTYLFIYNIFLTFNLITFGYFFGGSQFSFNIKYGVFGLYTYSNFVKVFYVSIMLGLTLIMSNVLVCQIFSQLIINVSSCFELIITSMIYHTIGLQLIPSGMTCLGYSFLVPGMVFIIGGHGALDNLQNKLNFELYKSEDEIGKRETLGNSMMMVEFNKDEKQMSSSKNKPFMSILQEEQNAN